MSQIHIHNQICINRLNIPGDIIDLIKDFTWYDLERGRLCKIKNHFQSIIKKSMCSYKESVSTSKYKNKTLYYFWIKPHKSQKTEYQIQCSFCLQCGNYTISKNNIVRFDPNHECISCKCLI